VLQERKNPVCLVEAFSHLTHVHHDAMLVIVGDIPGPYSDALHRVIEASGLGDRVRLVPVTSDVWQWYALSDVFVAAGDIESMPISILEAMAFGLPTAATDVFGVHELINDGDNGWLFPARDVPALIATLDRVLALSPQERHVIGAAGRETVLGGYGLRAHVANYQRLIDSLMSTPLRPSTQYQGGCHDPSSAMPPAATPPPGSSKSLQPPLKRRRPR
jgi:glycosyltransferase involved in cell wall biosynthesis